MCSRLVIGEGGDATFPNEIGALILLLLTLVAGRTTKACAAEVNRVIRRNTAVLDVMVVLCDEFEGRDFWRIDLEIGRMESSSLGRTENCARHKATSCSSD